MKSEGTLVAIGAHADDIELHAGGVAASAAALGWPVHFVMSTNNMSGDLVVQSGDGTQVEHRDPDATREVRHGEQQAAADVIGAKLHLLDYPQRHYWSDGKRVSLTFSDVEHHTMPASSDKPPLIIAAQNKQAIERLGRLLTELQPTMLLTHTVTDFDPEHHATASLVYQAFRKVRQELPDDATLLFWAPGTTSRAGMLRQSYDCILPFDEAAYEQKMQMLNCHASQMTSRRLEMAERRARLWGAEIEAPFAETFTTVISAQESSIDH